MAESLSDKPDDEHINEVTKKLADALARAGLGTIKLADLVDAAIRYALALCGGDRKLAAQLLEISPEHLDFKLDAPRNGSGES
jgi:hypothetical protein